MNKPAKIALTVFALAIGMSVFYGIYKVITFSKAVYNELPDHAEITDAFKITTEWQEIELKSPIKKSEKNQYVGLLFKDRITSWTDTTCTHLISEKGDTIHVELDLITETNSMITTRPYSIGGNHVGFFPLLKLNIPEETVYTKIRLKSDEPIEVNEIIYSEYVSK